MIRWMYSICIDAVTAYEGSNERGGCMTLLVRSGNAVNSGDLCRGNNL